MATMTFKDLCQENYKAQAVWWLNGMWRQGAKEEREHVWKLYKKMVELESAQQQSKGKNGNELDAFQAARFLEIMNGALTSIERKEAFKVIDTDNNGRMALIEYLLWKYEKPVDAVINSPQGENTEALNAAQAKMDEVTAKLNEVLPKVEEAKKAAEEAHAAEQALKAAEAELQAAVDDLNKKEAEHKAKMEALEATSQNQDLGVVKRNKAANELEQMKAEDPLPLRRAKITQEAALKKVAKQAKLAEAATAAAEARKAELEQAQVELEEAMNDAVQELEDVKKRGGPANGGLWWMQRELYEADESLPRAKQRFDHSKECPYEEI